MAIAKLSLRKKSADDESADSSAEETPKKTLMKKRLGAGPSSAADKDDAEDEAPAPKKLLKKAPAEEEAEEPEDEAPAPKKLLKKAPAEEEAEEPEDEAPAPKKAVKTLETEVVDEDEAPTPKKLAVRKKALPSAAGEEDEELDALPGVDRSPVVYDAMKLGAIDGPIESRDLSRPRIQLVQNNSTDLEEAGFTVGQIALAGEVLIWDKGCDPLSVVLMTGRKRFSQKLTDDEYKEGVIPMTFDSPEAAEEAGFRTTWEGDQPPEVDAFLSTLFLVEQPDFIEPNPIFNLEYEDRRFTIAEMKFAGVNYRSRGVAGNWLMTQSRGSLLPDTRLSMLAMSASREKQKKSGNIVTVAKFRNLGKHSDQEFADWILSLS
jgi:hypothetical protein